MPLPLASGLRALSQAHEPGCECARATGTSAEETALCAAGAAPARMRGRALRRAGGARLWCGISYGSDALGSRSSPDVPVPSASPGAARAGPCSPAPRACSAPARARAGAGRHACRLRGRPPRQRRAPDVWRLAGMQTAGRGHNAPLTPSVVRLAAATGAPFATSFLPWAAVQQGRGCGNPVCVRCSGRGGRRRGRAGERGVAGGVGGALDALRHRRLLPGLRAATPVDRCLPC